ncbi:MAG: SprB repeat-containing protein, partial [Bacteroidota bacterium]
MRFIRTLIIFAFLSLLSGDLFAQPCSAVGCLGDNLVTNGDFETFNPGNPFGDFSSQYNFNGPCGPGANDCGDFLCFGTFAIETSPFPCNPGWSDNVADHTFADGTGNFMVVDFSNNNSEEIWCQTIDLQPNVQYCFGGWFINILPNGSPLPPPEIRFEVDGAFVGISAGIQANEQWSFSGVTVSSGTGGPAEFCIINQNFGEQGFDIGIDDISVREVDPNGGPNTANDIARVCSPTDPVTFNPLVNDSPNGSPIDLTSFGIFTAPPFSQGTITSVDQTSGNITFQPAGNFTSTAFEYIICDAAGCCQIATVNVTVNPDINLTTTGDNLTCATLGTGTVGVNASGGTAPYTYAWDNADNVQNPTGLNPGIFTVTVTDAFGCQETATAEITGPPLVDFDLVPTNVSCFGETDGSIQLVINGGLAPFDFDWDNAPDVQDPSGLTAGIYTVTVTDGNACFATGSAEIIEPAELLGGITLNNGVSCNGSVDGSATVDAGGGTPPFTYLWDNGDGDATQNMLPGGI